MKITLENQGGRNWFGESILMKILLIGNFKISRFSLEVSDYLSLSQH
ncbi:hypothetical protein [Desertivirga arenae]|nr:hypothetical protein [Pedobacter sp. SYSU D00823]